MIDISFSVSKAEYIQAQKLYIRQRQKTARIIAILVVGMMVFAVAMFAYTTSGLMAGVTTALAFCAFMAVIYFVTTPITQWLVLGMRYRQEARYLTDAHIVISEDGVDGEAQGLGNGHNEWRAFTGWLEGKTMMVMVMGYIIRPLPKRVFSEPELAELRTLMTTHIGPVNKLRRF